MNLNESQTKSEHEIRRNSYHKLLYRSPSLTSCRICDDGFIASTTGVLACVLTYCFGIASSNMQQQLLYGFPPQLVVLHTSCCF